MTRRITGTVFLLLLFLLSAPRVKAQQQDFQTWWEITLQKGFRNDFTLTGEIEQRFKNNSLQYDRSQFTLSGEYDLTRFLELSAGVRASLSTDRELQLRTRYRIHLDLTGNYAPSPFDLTLRSRLQYGIDDLVTFDDWSENKLVNRNRLRLQHHIFGTRLEWSLYAESWHQLNGSREKLFYKMRYAAEFTYDLNFNSQLGVRYILEDEFNVVDPLLAHILVFGYSRDL